MLFLFLCCNIQSEVQYRVEIESSYLTEHMETFRRQFDLPYTIHLYVSRHGKSMLHICPMGAPVPFDWGSVDREDAYSVHATKYIEEPINARLKRLSMPLLNFSSLECRPGEGDAFEYFLTKEQVEALLRDS